VDVIEIDAAPIAASMRFASCVMRPVIARPRPVQDLYPGRGASDHDAAFNALLKTLEERAAYYFHDGDQQAEDIPRLSVRAASTSAFTRLSLTRCGPARRYCCERKHTG